MCQLPLSWYPTPSLGEQRRLGCPTVASGGIGGAVMLVIAALVKGMMAKGA